MSQIQPERKGNRPEGHEQWTVWDSENDNARYFDGRPAAEERKDEIEDMFDGLELELYPPGESPEALYHAEENRPDDTDDASEEPEEDDDGVPCTECGEPVDPDAIEFDGDRNPYHPDCWANGGDSVEAEIVETTPDADAVEVENADPEPVEPTPDAPAEDVDLPERSVSDELDARSLQQDPLDFLPSYMIDKVQGTPTLNKRGLSVLAFHYGIEVTDRTIVVNPHESDWECAIVETEVTDEGGRAFIGTGTAHVDRGDDKEILLEMAETRSYKRAVSFATGTGIVSYQEMVSELE